MHIDDMNEDAGASSVGRCRRIINQMCNCQHADRAAAGRVCIHLQQTKDLGYFKRFTGCGIAYDLLCHGCTQPSTEAANLVNVCAECFRAMEASGSWGGIRGTPEVRVATRSLHFDHQTISVPELAGLDILDVQPIETSESAWLACTSTGLLIHIDTSVPSIRTITAMTQNDLDFDGGRIREKPEDRAKWLKGSRCTLCVSDLGDLAAVANTYGQRGVVVDLATGRPTMHLRRDAGHEDVSGFPIAFCTSDGRDVIIHGTQWNRLDASDARTGVLLTQRQPTSYKNGEPRPAHYLDYFHCQLLVSPGQQYIADNGWVWAPVGIITTWNLSHWLQSNVWESEDGASKKEFYWRGYFWDGPLCWINDHRLAVWGYGEEDEWLLPAVSIFDVRSGQEERWFAGPEGSLAFDDYLFSFSRTRGMQVWDIERGERLADEPDFCPQAYHRRAKCFLSVLEGGVVRLSRLRTK